MSKSTPLLVLGLGNVLLEDDGIGSAAVALLLERYEPPPGVQVLDGGTLGLSLLPYLEDADAVILVDAIKADRRPGSLIRLNGDDVPLAVAARLSPHQVGVADLLDGARWLERYPARLVLLGVVLERIGLAVGLSRRARLALPFLVDRIVDEARLVGCAFRRRTTYEKSAAGSALDIARLARMC